MTAKSLRRARGEVAEFKKIYQDMRAFQRDQLLWTPFSEYRCDSYMASVKH